MKFEEPISGAILIVGSLYWDDHATRKSLRNKLLLMPNSKSVPAPIRYGRKSDLRNTVTMVFSNSCADEKLGSAKLVPFKKPIASSKELDEITSAIIKAEHKKEPDFSRFNWEWGCLAVLVNPKASSKSVKQIKDYWSKKIGKKFDSKEYKIGKEKSVVSSLGVLQIEWQNEYGEIDFVVVTATKPNISPIPECDELAKHFKLDSHYFESNSRNGISTYQDKEVITLLVEAKSDEGVAPKFDQLPEGWGSKTLGQLFEFKNGINSDKESYGKGTRFINVMEVIYNDHIVPEIIPGTVHISKDQKDLFMVKNGDVLFNRTSETANEIGLSAVYLGNDPVVFGGFVIRGRPLDTSLDNDYKRYCFRSKIVRDQIIRAGQGGVRTNIGQDDLGKVLVPLPSLLEQNAIASLLLTWDKAIETSNRLLRSKLLQRKGLAEQLLSGKRRLKSFKGKWSSLYVKDIFDFIPTSSFSRECLTSDAKAELHYIHYGDIHALFDDDILDLNIESRVPFLKKEFHSPSLAILEDGDLIIADASEDYNGVGESVEIVNIGARRVIAGLHTILLRDKDNVTSLGFKGHLFNSNPILNSLRRIATGTSVYSISKSSLSSLKINVPSIEEQTAITLLLSESDKEIRLLKHKLELLKKQKSGLIQLLMTGKKRLKF